MQFAQRDGCDKLSGKGSGRAINWSCVCWNEWHSDFEIFGFIHTTHFSLCFLGLWRSIFADDFEASTCLVGGERSLSPVPCPLRRFSISDDDGCDEALAATSSSVLFARLNLVELFEGELLGGGDWSRPRGLDGSCRISGSDSA